MLRIGIISYLPRNEKRELRKKETRRAFDNLMKVVPKDCQVYCVAQCYDEEDYLPNVNYIKFDEGIGPSRARNALLDAFYKSEDDFMLYIDDDNYIYDRYNVKHLFQEIHEYPDKFKLVDMFCGIHGRFSPFTKENEQLDLNHFYHFKQMPFQTTGELRILRNLRKYGKELIYYDPECKVGEDLDLRIRLEARNDIFCYCCNNIIQGTYCMDYRTAVCWDAKDENDYNRQQAESAAEVKRKYGSERYKARMKPGQFILRIPNGINIDNINTRLD